MSTRSGCDDESTAAAEHREKPLDHIRSNLCKQTLMTSSIVARSLERLERNSQRVLANINKEISTICTKKKQLIRLEETLKEENAWLLRAIQQLETFEQAKERKEKHSQKSQKKSVRIKKTSEPIQ